MNFYNDQVDSATLPRAEEVLLQPIEIAYKKIVVWEWLITWIIVAMGVALTLLFTTELHQVLWIFLIVVTLVIFSTLNLWLKKKSFEQKAYAVRDRDIIYRSGWLIQRISISPFNRIQHCSVSVGPFEKKLGLSSLSIFTAGTEGADIKIPGLKEADALSLRDFIMKKIVTDEEKGN